MRLIAPITVAILALVLSGCGGSSNYAKDAQTAVNNMAAAIRTYNSAKTGNVAATGAACRQALDQLSSSSSLVSETPPSGYKQAGDALAHAYAEASAGFGDCAAGAPAFDYARMVKAESEIANANIWITTARNLDRSAAH